MANHAIIGVDYGTTTTQVSVLTDSGIPDLVEVGQGQGYERYLVRSVIGIDVGANHSVVGDEAVERPNRVILPSLKRCLMCSYDKATGEGKCTNIPNQALCSGLGRYKIGDRTHKVEELIGLFMKAVGKSLKAVAEAKGIKIESSEVRFSVPSTYEAKTIALLSRAIQHGLNVEPRREVKYEPASALATLFKQGYLDDGVHVVCDIGGGTTDLAMIHKTEEGAFLLEPDSLMIGGNDLDQCLFDYLRPRVNSAEYSNGGLMRECRVAKERLSRNDRTRIGNVELDQTEFERLAASRIEEIASFVHDYIDRRIATLEGLRPSMKIFEGEPTAITGRFVTPDGEKPIRPRTVHLQIHLAGGGSKVPLIERRLKGLEFDRVRVRVTPVRGRGASDVYGQDFPIFCIALGNVLDFENFNLFSLPVTIRIQRGRKLEKEIRSHTGFPVMFSVDWGRDLMITGLGGTRSFDLMESQQCEPPISGTGSFLQKHPESLEVLFRKWRRCRFLFMQGGYFRVEGPPHYSRWFKAPWKNVIDENKQKLKLTNVRKEIGLNAKPRK